MDLLRDGFRDPALVKAVGRMKAWDWYLADDLAADAADADEVEVVLGDIQTAVLLVDDRP